MDETLKRLLAAEQRATEITAAAQAAAEESVRTAQEEARVLTERFREQIPLSRRAYLDKAEERAEQAISELKRRHSEQVSTMREAAEAHEEQALEAAFRCLLSGDKES